MIPIPPTAHARVSGIGGDDVDQTEPCFQVRVLEKLSLRRL